MASDVTLNTVDTVDDEDGPGNAHEVDYVPSTRLRAALKSTVDRALFEGSDAYGWLITLRVVLPLVAAFVVLPYARARLGYWVWPIAVPLFGVLLYKVQFVQHDCSHKSLFRSLAWNERVGELCGLFAGMSLATYRRIHGAHHRFNGEPDDPQFGDFLGDRIVPRWSYVWFIFSPLVGGRVGGFINRELRGLFNALRPTAPPADAAAPGAPAGSKRWLAAMVLFHLVLATLATGFWRYPSLALVYFVGGFTVTLFLARVRTLAEHEQPPGKSPVSFTRSHQWNLFDAVFLYEASFNYHLEHHIFPHMPSKNLAAFSRRYGPGLFHSGDTLGRSMVATLWQRFVASPRTAEGMARLRASAQAQ